MKKYIILKDTREKPGNGWNFRSSDSCAGMQVKGLKTGDYTIANLEHVLVIERKGCIAEFAQNLVQNYDRFCRELDRAEGYKYCFILLEFSMEDLTGYPRSADIPARVRSRIRVTGSLLLKRLIELQTKYKVHILFCGTDGQCVANAIFKKVALEYNDLL